MGNARMTWRPMAPYMTIVSVNSKANLFSPKPKYTCCLNTWTLWLPSSTLGSFHGQLFSFPFQKPYCPLCQDLHFLPAFILDPHNSLVLPHSRFFWILSIVCTLARPMFLHFIHVDFWTINLWIGKQEMSKTYGELCFSAFGNQSSPLCFTSTGLLCSKKW